VGSSDGSKALDPPQPAVQLAKIWLTINLPHVRNDLQPVAWPTANVNRTRLATSPRTDAIVTARRRGCNGSGDAIDMPAHAFSGERAGQ